MGSVLSSAVELYVHEYLEFNINDKILTSNTYIHKVRICGFPSVSLSLRLKSLSLKYSVTSRATGR